MDIPESTSAGYLWLAERFEVQVLPHWRESRILVRGMRRSIEREGRQEEYLPAAQDPGDDIFAQLEFALRREGIHLELLRKVLPRIATEDMETYLRSRPTGKYARIIWCLWEEFSGSRLNLPDTTIGNYVDLLDPDLYVTGPGRKSRRHRVNLNLLGSLDFSPMVRRKALDGWDEEVMREKCAAIVEDYPAAIFQRAVRYLYAKESKSSHDIEHETPDQQRAERFIRLLEQAWLRDFLTKSALVELQNAIVDPRYANHGWRSVTGEQVYVGETLAPGQERIHYVAPKPEDLDELMAGFLTMAGQVAGRMVHGTGIMTPPEVPVIVAAAVVSFVFNFLHPFSDGNGRIHRFLLHHVLARRRFGPEGIILPVSAVIVNRPREYDQALEGFSKPLLERVQYSLDDRLRMTVTNDTCDFYRYIDCTGLIRVTAEFLRETIETELPAELAYLTKHDLIRSEMRDIVDMPDRHADLFVRLCRQNCGTLSKNKRKLEEFAALTDEEVRAIEAVIRDHLDGGR